MNSYVCVVGAVNLDICGRPSRKLIFRDSNPGTVTLTPGGVGRNIAHNLCLLGMDVSLIAAIGGDVYGSSLMDGCRSLGMDMSMARVEPQRRSSTYLYVTDEMGDMCVGIADMDIAECVTPEHLASCIDRINRADALGGIEHAFGAETYKHALHAHFEETLRGLLRLRLTRQVPRLNGAALRASAHSSAPPPRPRRARSPSSANLQTAPISAHRLLFNIKYKIQKGDSSCSAKTMISSYPILKAAASPFTAPPAARKQKSLYWISSVTAPPSAAAARNAARSLNMPQP